MLLAIDIGNTNISLGVFKGKTLIKRYTIPTKEKDYLPKIERIFDENRIGAAIVCSVVPMATKKFAQGLRRLSSSQVYYIGKGLSVPIRNLYRKPRQVGQDRLVNAYAGVVLYGTPLIVVDFGTAITFDLISKDRAYLGGMILPGLEASLDALNRKTALLPRVSLGRPKEFIGQDTKSSMLSGVVYGFAALTDELVARIKEKIGKKALAIATGGNINLIRPYCKKLDRINKDLTFKGLRLIYEKI